MSHKFQRTGLAPDGFFGRFSAGRRRERANPVTIRFSLRALPQLWATEPPRSKPISEKTSGLAPLWSASGVDDRGASVLV